MLNNKTILICLAIILLISCSFLLMSSVYAQSANPPGDPAPPDDPTKESGGSFGSPKLENPLGDDVNVPILIGRVIKAILGVVGSIALAMFVYGGFVWMTSSGNTELVQKGRNTLIWASIGLVTIFAAYAIVYYIIEKGIRGG